MLYKKKYITQCSGYDTELHSVKRFRFRSFGEYGVTISLPLLPVQLLSGVVVTVRVSSLCQIGLFEIMKCLSVLNERMNLPIVSKM